MKNIPKYKYKNNNKKRDDKFPSLTELALLIIKDYNENKANE